MSIRAFRQHHPQLGHRVYVDPAAVVIGQVNLGNDVSVWPCAVIRGDLLAINIGDRSNIQDGSVLHTTHDSVYAPGGFALTIGKDVTVGHKAVLHGCTVEDECLIGMGAVVLDGAIIQSHVILAAGSVVGPGKILESGYVWRGNPVQKTRALTDQEKTFFKYSAQKYIDNKNYYLDV
jgi:carbonic anhydrase/acetyltransferase-like protein (isoleucine patch superfamily)